MTAAPSFRSADAEAVPVTRFNGAGDVIEAMLQTLEGGEQHTRPPLEVKHNSPFLPYIEIGSALRACLTPAKRDYLLSRLAPHRGLIIGTLPAGISRNGILPPVDALTRAALGLRDLEQIGDDELRQWLADDGRLIYGEWKRYELANYFDAVRARVKPGALFADLGSGLGKVVMTAALSLPFSRCVGVELLGYRHQMALQRAHAFLAAGARGVAALPAPLEAGTPITLASGATANASLLLNIGERLSFIEADMFKVDVSAADLIFIYSTCFAPLMDALAAKLAREMREGALVSSTTFPLNHPALRLVEHFPSGTISWTGVFLYERIGPLQDQSTPEPATLWEAELQDWLERARAEADRLIEHGAS